MEIKGVANAVIFQLILDDFLPHLRLVIMTASVGDSVDIFCTLTASVHSVALIAFPLHVLYFHQIDMCIVYLGLFIPSVSSLHLLECSELQSVQLWLETVILPQLPIRFTCHVQYWCFVVVPSHVLRLHHPYRFLSNVLPHL